MSSKESLVGLMVVFALMGCARTQETASAKGGSVEPSEGHASAPTVSKQGDASQLTMVELLEARRFGEVETKYEVFGRFAVSCARVCLSAGNRTDTGCLRAIGRRVTSELVALRKCLDDGYLKGLCEEGFLASIEDFALQMCPGVRFPLTP